MGRFQRIAVVVSLVGAATGSYVGSSDRVAAAPGTLTVSAAMRSCSDSRCELKQSIPAAASVNVDCWRDAVQQNGVNKRWFRVQYLGNEGWISASTVRSPQPSVVYCTSFRSGEKLFANQVIYSRDARFRLVMQPDGNLVHYAPGGQALWASMKSLGNPGAYAVMQPDGNLVVYRDLIALWSSGTNDNPGSKLSVQDDGNAVIYKAGAALWASSWYWTKGRLGSSNQGYVGQCTRLAQDRFHSYTGYWPYFSPGTNAKGWDTAASEQGWLVVRGRPVARSIVVFEANSGGASDLGHVGWVKQVQYRGADGHWFLMDDRNWDGAGGLRTNVWVKHQPYHSYIVAPDRS